MYSKQPRGPQGHLVEVNRRLRGHAFLPPLDQRRTIPGYKGQDIPSPRLAVVYLHYFAAGSDWWLIELWEDRDEPGQWVGFGYVRLGHLAEHAEWGLVSINDLEALCTRAPATGTPLIVERDVWWTPKPAHQCHRDLALPGTARQEDGDA